MTSELSSNVRSMASQEQYGFAGSGLSQRQLLAVLVVFFYAPIAYYYGYSLPPTIGIDFPSYFYAAKFAFESGKTPYGLQAFNGLPGLWGGKVQPYIYPPPSLLAFWPLAKLSVESAHWLFLAASHFSYLASIWLIATKLIPAPDKQIHRDITIGLCVVYMLCFFPAEDTLRDGQVNFVAVFFICLALVALKRRASAWQIALPLAIAIALKTYPVLLLMPLLFRKRFRAVALTCLFFAAFAIISVLVLPSNAWSTWYFTVVPLGGYANNALPAAFCWNQSLNAFVMRLFQEEYFSKAPLPYPSLAKPVATILALLVIGTTSLFSFLAAKRGNRRSEDLEDMAAFLLMIYIIAPLSWDHHLVYVLPCIALAISWLVNRSIRGKSAVLVLASIILMAWRLPIDRLDITHGWWTLLISAKLYPVIFLWLFFVNRLREPRTATSPIDDGAVEIHNSRDSKLWGVRTATS